MSHKPLHKRHEVKPTESILPPIDNNNTFLWPKYTLSISFDSTTNFAFTLRGSVAPVLVKTNESSSARQSPSRIMDVEATRWWRHYRHVKIEPCNHCWKTLPIRVTRKRFNDYSSSYCVFWVTRRNLWHSRHLNKRVLRGRSFWIYMNLFWPLLLSPFTSDVSWTWFFQGSLVSEFRSWTAARSRAFLWATQAPQHKKAITINLLLSVAIVLRWASLSIA